jgi:hypothetical protein
MWWWHSAATGRHRYRNRHRTRLLIATPNHDVDPGVRLALGAAALAARSSIGARPTFLAIGRAAVRKTQPRELFAGMVVLFVLADGALDHPLVLFVIGAGILGHVAAELPGVVAGPCQNPSGALATLSFVLSHSSSPHAA